MGSKKPEALLLLEDGSEFRGQAFGALRPSSGEVVFSTGMVGYPQSLTDPSYRGQILVLTYPLVGNYGVPALKFDRYGIPLDFESEKIQVSGLIISELSEEPSHYSAKRSLSAWMEEEGIPGISGIDTRALTQVLRERGVMRGRIILQSPGIAKATAMEDSESERRDADESHPVAEVSCAAPKLYKTNPTGPTIALIDCGVKANILRIMLGSGANVLRLSWDSDLKGIECDGIFISNGPGDPKACTKTIASVRRALQGDIPIFGICLGNQILALAAGADTYKLPYGHRGQNQPALEVGGKRCFMTSQNHGYAVREESIPHGWEPWFVNANDGTIEGLRSHRKPFSAVQFHPEGCPGPRDTQFLLEAFIAEAARYANNRRNA
ncbi:MAG: glutamine-hydrolyzing carbamoyl-phosphate synthase small subunit [Spirochaetia bacterium]|jgi:carbamoyl-phosphate synthase small subunit|nr:glutamine-hydrolyzing carbamoyl-phosphate synthase small subunit [Spirochaetales bacterium]MDX9783756.1 glutamine-hydrolyzing carbamoyl-phosphate synthase small subunit [Spirochaetia bacterium]